MNKTQNIVPYERLQSYNTITRWLHSVRYSTILQVVREYARTASPSPIRILDIGCGTCKLYDVLDRQFAINYTGCEVNPEFVKTVRSRYGHNSNFQVTDESVTSGGFRFGNYDLVVALETLEHIPERDVVWLLERIASDRPKMFICSVPVEIGPTIWLKNVGARVCGYPRYKEYTWAQTLLAGLYQLDKIPLHQTSHIGFDWRWLAQTVRHNMQVVMFRKFPLRWLPAAVSSSVFIVAKPR